MDYFLFSFVLFSWHWNKLRMLVALI